MSEQIPASLIAHLRSQWYTAQQQEQADARRRDDALVRARQAAAGLVESRAYTAGVVRLLAVADPANASMYAVAEPSERTDREAFLAGLREVTEFYELHPDLPVPEYPDLAVYGPSDDPDEEVAQVAAAAKLAGLSATRKAPNRHFKTELRFSGSVRLKFIATERTDSAWQHGDPLPEWYLNEQALYYPAAVEPEPAPLAQWEQELVAADQAPESAPSEPADDTDPYRGEFPGDELDAAGIPQACAGCGAESGSLTKCVDQSGNLFWLCPVCVPAVTV